MINVEIDKNAGFCGGVIRTISTAEEYLSTHEHLYSLGEIVHNESEIERLSKMGLVALDMEDLSEITEASGEPILIRAHGQPPYIYELLRKRGFKIIDCTCPVVLGIQNKIRQAQGVVIIFGKRGHPEVLGLVGQVEPERVRIIESAQEAQKLMDKEEIVGACEIFSQTTQSPVEYSRVCDILRASLPLLKVHDTICKQMVFRYKKLEDFALSHDVIIFVSGRSSSNGRVLSDLCKSKNFRTYQVGGVNEIQSSWFRPEDRVGVSGATSTPGWLLSEVASYIKALF
ncbi:MAG TPA: 4-hydroxy-3-methylbut-2-enyl diphosphate reductase [Rikenellaceae bacterium]|nr:4-hydroxy-3-methylbut-2-enyl diphosphate reductase [Rikenellaceae bacterium]